MTKLIALWRELNTPSDFAGQPYIGLLNQRGHTMLGTELYIYLACAWFAVGGEMPSGLVVAFAVSIAYGVVIEWGVQGWRKRDSLQDWLFVSLGAAVPAAAFQYTGGGFTGMQFTVDARTLIAGIGVGWILHGFYALRRLPR